MRPYTLFTDSIHIVSSDVFVTASGIAPRPSSRVAVEADSADTWPLRATTPDVFGIPSSQIDSLIVQGTPSSGGSSSPLAAAATRSSAASASARALS